MSDALAREARTRAERRWGLPDEIPYGAIAPMAALPREYVAGYVDGATRLDRDTLRSVIGSVLVHATNYPERVQARMLGQDMGPLTDKTADAVLAAMTTPTQQNGETHA